MTEEFNCCSITGETTCKCGGMCDIHNKCGCTTCFLSEKAPRTNLSIKDTFRKLFSDHSFFIYTYINSSVNKRIGSLPDNQIILSRIRANHKDLGDFLYKILVQLGVVSKKEARDFGNIFTEKLNNHLECLIALICSINECSTEKISSSKSRASDSCKETARYISTVTQGRANETDLKKEFDKHDKYVFEIADARYKEDYVKEIKLFDEFNVFTIVFSDKISNIFNYRQSDKVKFEDSGTKDWYTVKTLALE